MKHFFIILFTISCSTQINFLKEDKSSTEWGPREIIETTEQVSSSLNQFLIKNNSNVIEIGKFKNKTSEHIDTELLTKELMNSLIKNQIRFVDRTKRKLALEETELSQKGLTEKEIKLSIDVPEYILECTILDNVRYIDKNKVQYINVSFGLIKLSTSSVVWQENKNFIKETKKPYVGW